MLHYIVAVLRILIGLVFLWFGISKLADEELLYGGLLHKLEQYGAPFPLYQRFLSRFVELHQEFFAFAVAIGEILVGVSLLTGTLVSLSALGGAFLMLNYGFATSYGNLERLIYHFAYALVFLVLGRQAAGLTWGVDGWLVQHIRAAVILFPFRRSVPS